MPKTDVLATTPRSATLLLAPDGARFAQPTPLPWRLMAGGDVIAEGEAQTTVLFLDDLTPATDYRLETGLGVAAFVTPGCAGRIDITDHGAREDADCTDAIQSAIDLVPEGGTLWVPEGRYMIRPVFLRPRMTLHLAPGAILAAPGARDGWPVLPARDPDDRPLGTWEGLPEASFAAPLTAIDCHGLAITGRGILDAGGDRGDWWDWPKETRDGARRPRALHLAYCNDVSLTGITVRNSPSWTVHPYRCDRLTVAALQIQNPPDSPNTDGLNPESCQDVTLTGIDFSVGDDCIAIKAGKRGPGPNDHLAPCRALTVSHCRMQRGHGAVVIGSEMSGGIEDVTIRDCDFIGTDRGLRIKTRRGRGSRVRDIHLSDVEMTDVSTPLAVNAFYFCDPDGHDRWVQDRAPAPVDETTPCIEGVTLTRVRARGVTCAAAAILGLPEAPVRDLRITDFAVSYSPASPAPPLMADGVDPVAGAGLIATFAEVQGMPTPLRTPEDAPC